MSESRCLRLAVLPERRHFASLLDLDDFAERFIDGSGPSDVRHALCTSYDVMTARHGLEM